MTTYNTYQEAKIANTECAVFEYQGNFGTDKEILDMFDIQSREMKECDPADCCMTLDKFLSDGFKLEIGDVIFGEGEDNADVVSSDLHCRSFNMPVDADRNIYILRAAALENIPTEAPEEKEVLDGIDSAGEIEWKNGDECEIEMQEGVRRYLFGCECPNNQQTCIVFTKDGGGHMVMPIERLKKPETPQQREDRERLEAGYELYKTCGIQHETVSFNEWVDDYKDVWLNIVDKTNYRKEKAHGAN